ncbi:MAG: cyclopropane-fatty-acyl-phospholipid synthase, partial [Rhodobacteraceae bacterium]|nr:cyclopropane-fatty-acyl-phospholipid synthase [Paracoccaceae bacterium]
MWWKLLCGRLERLVRQGTLVLENAAGHRVRFGAGAPEVKVRLTDPALPRHFLRTPDLTLGEAYMDGTLIITGDDLFGLLSLLMMNLPDSGRPADPGWGGPVAKLLLPVMRRVQQMNPPLRARRNVAHHYDLPDALYRLFLDSDMQYSCAYFRHPTDDLEKAQAEKKAHIAKKLLLQPGMNVLDIGCGWGGMALTLARDHGVKVLGVTLSERQHRVACDRAERAGLADRAVFRLMDYRAVRGRFDRVVSVGMFEHVGVPQFDQFFGHLRDRLTDEGVALIHTIGRAARPSATG